MPRRAPALLLVLLLAVALAGCRDDQDPPGDDGSGSRSSVVETESGAVRGAAQSGVESWRGIPYAAPPVGDLRWAAPRPAAAWDGVRDATEYGRICPQGLSNTMAEALSEAGPASEDCLTLNVHRPAGTRAEDDLPVMVFLHGGGFVYGSGSEAQYNSPELVKRGVVLVTLNYRLGRLGFFTHPALQEGLGRVGNYGLLDQVRALTWVQRNVGAFGGDPDNVTIFGESAGGVSVNALMVAPAARGLFDRAVAQSGFGREPAVDWDESVAEATAAFAPLVGQEPTAADLRALDAEQVMDVAPSMVIRGQIPVRDDILPTSVTDAFRAGTEAPVPYLAGSTDLELADDAGVPGMLAADARALLLEDRRSDAVAAYGSDGELGLRLLSDVLFGEPARHLAEEHTDAAPTYRYRFAIAPGAGSSAGGAPHTAELPYVFDDTARQGTPVEGADALADEIADLWVEFARTGAIAGWPREETGEVMTFTVNGPVAGPDPWSARLDVVVAAYEQLAATAG